MECLKLLSIYLEKLLKNTLLVKANKIQEIMLEDNSLGGKGQK